MQRTLRKMNDYFDEKKNKKLYPKSSRPGLFYGTAIIQKLGKGEGLIELTMRPIISNIGTATYERDKYRSFTISRAKLT